LLCVLNRCLMFDVWGVKVLRCWYSCSLNAMRFRINGKMIFVPRWSEESKQKEIFHFWKKKRIRHRLSFFGTNPAKKPSESDLEFEWIRIHKLSPPMQLTM
jgi:hypothetical protein